MANVRSAVVHQITGKRFMGVAPSGQRVMIDGESVNPTGMRPTELLLSAVGACAAYDIAEMIRKRRLDLRSYRVEVVGERAEGTPAYFTRITATHIFDAPGLERSMAERFVDLGMNKYCSVASSLRSEIRFEVVLEHEQEELEEAARD